MRKIALLALLASILLLSASVLFLHTGGIDSDDRGGPFPFLRISDNHFRLEAKALLLSFMEGYICAFIAFVLFTLCSSSRRLWIAGGLVIGAWLCVSSLMAYRIVSPTGPDNVFKERGVPFYWLSFIRDPDVDPPIRTGTPYYWHLSEQLAICWDPDVQIRSGAKYSIAYGNLLKAIIFWSVVGLVGVRCASWLRQSQIAREPPSLSTN